jgi:hypothetical protein
VSGSNPLFARWLEAGGYWPSAANRALRIELARTHSFAIPSEQALAAIGRHAPIVEVGAGTGYWAHLLEQRGVDILPYDRAPPNEWSNGHHNKFHGNARPWTRIHTASAEVAARHPDRTLMLCWPPYDMTMSEQAIDAYDGDTIIYIGEEPGGVTATYGFFARLTSRFALTTSFAVPRWCGCRDFLTVWRRA